MIREPVCFGCKRFFYFPFCEAFPEGIPDEIRLGENDHTNPVSGDNGLMFEPLETSVEDYH